MLINPPVYPPFFFRISLLGREVVEAPLAVDGAGRYDLDLDLIDSVLAAGHVRAYLLCSPHNPVGRVWSRDQLTAIADSCARHGTALIVDEIHAPLILPGARHVPFLSLDHPVTERVIAFNSASKGWNIPGLKCGVAIAGSPAAAAVLRRALGRAARGRARRAGLGRRVHPRPGLAGRDAGPDRRVTGTCSASLLAEHLPAVGYVPPQASFLAWLDCRALGLGDDPAAAFLERGRVALSPGPDFGAAGRGHARLNMGTSPELLAEAVRRMAAALLT